MLASFLVLSQLLKLMIATQLSLVQLSTKVAYDLDV